MRLCNIYNIVAQFMKLMVGLRLADATSKNNNLFDIAVFPPLLLKVNMTPFVNNIIRVRRQDIPKQSSIETLIDEIDGNATDVSHVLHGSNHYWLTYSWLLKVDKFHSHFLLTIDNKKVSS